MFVKTRIPKHTNCVRIYASEHVEAYRLAALFMGEKGRLATAMDVMKIRAKSDFKHPIWNCYLTSASTEWFGLDPEGEPMIAVLHDPSPLTDEKLLREHYRVDRSQNHEFNVVSRQMFWDVINGEYGKVECVFLTNVINEHNSNSNKLKYLDKGQIEKSLLVGARLSHSYTARQYTLKHLAGSMLENIEHSQSKPGNIETAFLDCACDQYFPAFIGLTENHPQNYLLDLSHSPINLEASAIGHFLTFGAVTNGNVSDISVSDAGCDAAFLAICDEEEIYLDDKLHGYGANDYLERLSSLFVPYAEYAGKHDYFQVNNFGGWYFTQRYRSRVAIGDKQKEWFVTADPTYVPNPEPEFLVKSLKPLGRRTIKIPHSVAYYAPENDIKRVFKNPEANAFQIISGFKNRGKNYVAVIEYYQAEIYTDRRIPTEAEIVSNPKLLGRII